MNLPILDAPRAARLRRKLTTGRTREIILFLVIGGTSAVIYTGLNTVLTTAGLRPSVSILLTLAVLVPPTYLAQHRLTFRSGRNHASAFPRYLGTQLFGNVLALIAAELFPTPIRTYPLTAFILIAFMVAVTNYGILKFWAFRHPSVSASEAA
jgi:putative flippase GtrA